MFAPANHFHHLEMHSSLTGADEALIVKIWYNWVTLSFVKT